MGDPSTCITGTLGVQDGVLGVGHDVAV
jgi:hypothetical protein